MAVGCFGNFIVFLRKNRITEPIGWSDTSIVNAILWQIHHAVLENKEKAHISKRY